MIRVTRSPSKSLEIFNFSVGFLDTFFSSLSPPLKCLSLNGLTAFGVGLISSSYCYFHKVQSFPFFDISDKLNFFLNLENGKKKSLGFCIEGDNR